jgi:hypothetical protein
MVEANCRAEASLCSKILLFPSFQNTHQTVIINPALLFSFKTNSSSLRLPIPILYRPRRGTHMFGGVVFQQLTDTGAHPLLFPDLIPVFCQVLAVAGSSAPPRCALRGLPVEIPWHQPALVELLLVRRAPLGAELVPVELPCNLPVKLPKGSSWSQSCSPVASPLISPAHRAAPR